ncbi:MAG: hypothetical protein JWM91_3877, partial [Rhodospirillales bacterium]|nr:hypothetical protein [Rhodospirillales bacterium]
YCCHFHCAGGHSTRCFAIEKSQLAYGNAVWALQKLPEFQEKDRVTPEERAACLNAQPITGTATLKENGSAVSKVWRLLSL